MKRNDKGFSLIELIVVIAIMAVLVGVLAPTLLRYVEKAKEGKDAQAMGEILNELYIVAADMDAYMSVPDEGITLTHTADTDTLTILPSTGATEFEKELAASVGETITFSSTTWKATAFTVTITTTWDALDVVLSDELKTLMPDYKAS